ncbi:MAG: hypothetical protein GY720_09140 [bacterium]|nr:hypothetical protein [bacterium]
MKLLHDQFDLLALNHAPVRKTIRFGLSVASLSLLGAWLGTSSTGSSFDLESLPMPPPSAPTTATGGTATDPTTTATDPPRTIDAATADAGPTTTATPPTTPDATTTTAGPPRTIDAVTADAGPTTTATPPTTPDATISTAGPTTATTSQPTTTATATGYGGWERLPVDNISSFQIPGCVQFYGTQYSTTQYNTTICGNQADLSQLPEEKFEKNDRFFYAKVSCGNSLTVFEDAGYQGAHGTVASNC